MNSWENISKLFHITTALSIFLAPLYPVPVSAVKTINAASVDDDGAVHGAGVLTPDMGFFEYFDDALGQFVCIGNAPWETQNEEKQTVEAVERTPYLAPAPTLSSHHLPAREVMSYTDDRVNEAEFFRKLVEEDELFRANCAAPGAYRFPSLGSYVPPNVVDVQDSLIFLIPQSEPLFSQNSPLAGGHTDEVLGHMHDFMEWIEENRGNYLQNEILDVGELVVPLPSSPTLSPPSTVLPTPRTQPPVIYLSDTEEPNIREVDEAEYFRKLVEEDSEKYKRLTKEAEEKFRLAEALLPTSDRRDMKVSEIPSETIQRVKREESEALPLGKNENENEGFSSSVSVIESTNTAEVTDARAASPVSISVLPAPEIRDTLIRVETINPEIQASLGVNAPINISPSPFLSVQPSEAHDALPVVPIRLPTPTFPSKTYNGTFGHIVDPEGKNVMFQLSLEAAQGNINALVNLAERLEVGEGTEKNENEAAALYELAANQGHAIAQHNLGLMREMGRGEKKDREEAIRLYQQAASQGHPEAPQRLAILQQEGGCVLQ